MKNSLKLFIGILAIGLVAFSACKKKKDESPRAKLLGKWKVVQTGYDANNNSVMEPTEVATMSDSLILYSTFEDNGNGAVTVNIFGQDISMPFTWSLINNDADISMKMNITGLPMAIPEGVAHIHTLTFTDLITRDTTSTDSVSMASWTVFKKQ